MNQIARELQSTVEQAAERLLSLPEPPGEAADNGTWSAKQILGHLINSAANNHARFVRAQFTDDLLFPGYEQEQRVAAQRYDAEPWAALVQLWKAYNLHLAHVINYIPEGKLKQERTRHSLDKIAGQTVSADQPTTLEYLVAHYLWHVKVHLDQLFVTQ